MKYISISIALTICLATTFSQATDKSLGNFPFLLQAALGAGAGAGSGAGATHFSPDTAPAVFAYAQEKYETQDSNNAQEPCLFDDSEITSLSIEPSAQATKSKSTSKKEKEEKGSEKPKKSKHSPSKLARRAELARQSRARKKQRKQNLTTLCPQLEELRDNILLVKKEASVIEGLSKPALLAFQAIIKNAPEILRQVSEKIETL